MARSKRRPQTGRSPSSPADGGSTSSGEFLNQIGLFESANGMPHGPVAIVMAFGLALTVYPIARLLRTLVRR